MLQRRSGLVTEQDSGAPGRRANHLAKVSSVKMRLFVSDVIALDVAKSRIWLVFDAVVERLNDVFLELRRANVLLGIEAASVIKVMLITP